MNLHAIVSPAIGAVNPRVTVAISQSAPSMTLKTGQRIPQYNSFPAYAQIQPLTGGDLKQLDGLNLNGTMKKFYFFGVVAATVRASQKGGDIVTLLDGSEWLCSQVLEQWPDWVAIVGVLQNNTVAN